MSEAGYSMLGAGAWGWPTEMLWGGRWEGGSCLGMHVRIKDFKIKKNKKIKQQQQQKETNASLFLGRGEVLLSRVQLLSILLVPLTT